MQHCRLISPSVVADEAVLPGSGPVHWPPFSATVPWWTPAGGLYTPVWPDCPPLLWCFLGNLELSEAWIHEDLDTKKKYCDQDLSFYLLDSWSLTE